MEKVTESDWNLADKIETREDVIGILEAASFMQRQDEGGYHEAKGKRLRIFTDKARESGTKAGKVKRPLLKKVTIYTDSPVKRAAIAYKSGLLAYFGKSLFQVTSFKKRGDSVVFEKKMIINRKFERNLTPAKNFFLPECQEAAKDIQSRFNEAMERNKDKH